jgi:membrane protein
VSTDQEPADPQPADLPEGAELPDDAKLPEGVELPEQPHDKGKGKDSRIKVIGGHVVSGQSWVNHFQARHFIIAFPFAVFRKYADDKASRLSAMLTYYGFISLFPILLLLTAILQMILRGNPDLQQRIIDTIIPEQLRATVEQALTNLPSAGIPLAIGIISLLLAGLGGAYAAYAAVTQILAIPYRKWYGFGPRYIRVIATLLLLIFGAIGLGVLLTVSGREHIPVVGSPAWNFVIALGFLWLLLHFSIKLLAPRKVPLSETWVGVTLASISLLLLINLAGRLLALIVEQRTAVYGVFASFIGLLAFAFLMAQAIVISAEISTVWAWRLWPRSVDIMEYFDADVRAMQLLANMEERMPRERVSIDFVDDPKDDPDPFKAEWRTRGTGSYGRGKWGERGVVEPLDSGEGDLGSES